MMRALSSRVPAFLLVSVLALSVGCSRKVRTPRPMSADQELKEGSVEGVSVAPNADCSTTGLGSTERRITLLGTNDIHGAVEPVTKKTGVIGGMAFWSGVVGSVREGIDAQFGKACGGALVVDGGDQFQGTLLSNSDEGEMMFSLFNRVGYDAVVPGNHDYDFGPLGWLEDQVSATTAPELRDPFGVIRKLSKEAKFPLLSANTYDLASIKDFLGNPVSVKQVGCAADDGKIMIDWASATRPDFLQPYVIKEVAGVRVALIGLDNPITPTTTTPANISTLCFGDPVRAYYRVRNELVARNAADVFVIVIHSGDSSTEFTLTNMLKQIIAADDNGVDAIIGGHTHYVNNILVEGIPAIQSGANGEMFGRIDLTFDTATKKVVRAKTRVSAGAQLAHAGCDTKAAAFCEFATGATEPAYDGKKVVIDGVAEQMISDAATRMAPMGDRLVGTALKKLTKDRVEESPLSDILTDAIRAVTGGDIAMTNTGGIRTEVDAGPVTYEKLYQVQPFNNRAVLIGPIPTSTVVAWAKRSVASCGKYGSVLFSGIRGTFSRDCSKALDGLDPAAKLLTLELLDGTKIYDDAAGGIVKDMNFKVGTLDFLAAGGDGFIDPKSFSVLGDFGIFREAMVDQMVKNPVTWDGNVDGRWKNTLKPFTPSWP